MVYQSYTKFNSFKDNTNIKKRKRKNTKEFHLNEDEYSKLMLDIYNKQCMYTKQFK